MSKIELDELFTYYGSDKTKHGYTSLYHSLFKYIKDKPIDLLEIGIGTMIENVPSSMVGYALNGYKPGGCRDYFTKGNILGVYIQPDTQFSEERITISLGNSLIKDEIDSVLKDKMFDIIIDDGSHLDHHQLMTLRNVYPYLKTGGYYIIEDVLSKFGSKMIGDFHTEVKKIIGDDFFYMNDGKDLLIISKRL